MCNSHNNQEKAQIFSKSEGCSLFAIATKKSEVRTKKTNTFHIGSVMVLFLLYANDGLCLFTTERECETFG